MDAQAFTHGADIYFARGKYQPGTQNGQHLLAHELTHVVQQTGDGTARRRIQRLMTSQDLRAAAGKSGFIAFLRNSTYTKIVRALDKYHKAKTPEAQLAHLGSLRTLIVKWLSAHKERQDTHGTDTKGESITDDSRRAQLIILLDQVGAELSQVGAQGLTSEETGVAGEVMSSMMGRATTEYRGQYEKAGESGRANMKAGIFRSNDDVTKSMAAYTRMVGLPYLKDVLEPALTEALTTPDIKATRAVEQTDQEEVTKLGQDVSRTKQLYRDLVGRLFGSVEAAALVPPQLAQMVAKSYDAVYTVTNDPQTAYSALVNTLFLRFIGPYITTKQLPDGRTSSTLVTLSAILQVQANRTRFNAENKAVFNDVVNDCAPGFARFVIEVYRLGGGQHTGSLKGHLPEEAQVEDVTDEEVTEDVTDEGVTEGTGEQQGAPPQPAGVEQGMTGGLTIQDRLEKLRQAGLQI
jgi:hypothetical protein